MSDDTAKQLYDAANVELRVNWVVPGWRDLSEAERGGWRRLAASHDNLETRLTKAAAHAQRKLAQE